MKQTGIRQVEIDQYLKVVEDRRSYMGDRYFRFNYNSQTVVQVCISTGDVIKKGKANTIGVYVINKMTLFSNYMAMNYVVPCTKKEFENKFEYVVKILK